MQEPTKRTINNTESAVPVQRGCIDEHTCACGEIHEQDTGDVSHREACTSTVIPAAANRMMMPKTHPTAAGMDHAANKKNIILFTEYKL
jgi:hypothetical protein